MALIDTASIAVVIPCFNEGLTVGTVVRDFRQQLPQAKFYVFDNNSTDDTASVASEAGAIVIKEKRQGKGNVIAAIFTKIDADYFVMVDGDNTYPADMVLELLKPLLNEQADMVVGQRLSNYMAGAFPSLHLIGNKIICKIINSIFSSNIQDPLSGYRAYTREIADNLPVIAKGFDIETELTLQLLYRGFVLKEIEVPYRARPTGSSSKLKTFQDGFKILFKIFSIFKAYKPLTFFGGLGIIFGFVGLLTGRLVINQYIMDHYIDRIIELLIAIGCFIIAIVFASIGLILNTMNFRILELNNVMSKQFRKLETRIRK